MILRHFAGLFAALFLAMVAVAPAAQAQQKPEALAQQSAESWLALVDSGKFADSWDNASSYFKDRVSKDKWQEMVRPVREPLGKVMSRKLQSAQFTKSLPGAPDGQYVVLRYDTSFANKQSAVETITPMLDKDGQWRVSGYFIK